MSLISADSNQEPPVIAALQGDHRNASAGPSAAIYAEPALLRPRLKIGVMLDSLTVSAWVARIIAEVAKTPYLDLTLVVLNDAPAPPPPGFWERLKTMSPTLLWALYHHFDSKYFKSPNDAFAQVDLGNLLRNVPVIKARPIQKKFVDRFEEQDVQAIKSANVDVVLRFGFRVIKGEILNCAKYGVWSLHHDNNLEYRGSPPMFWEICENNPLSGTVLQVLTEQLDGGQVIYRSHSATDFSSLRRNRNPKYWKSTEFMLRRLRELYTFGWEHIQSLPTFREVSSYNKPIYRSPRNPVMARYLGRLAGRVLRGRVERFWRQQWFIGIQKRSGADGRGQGEFRLFYPPRDRFYADPFLFSDKGKDFLFFEDFSYPEGKAVISCVELDAQGRPSQPEVILTTPYHLSYPFLFRWNGEIFMMPETGCNHTVEVYRTVEFPHRWRLEKVMLSGIQALDPTLLEYNGNFWLFANVVVPGGPVNDELFVFYADTPLGPWQPHPKNPVVSDVRSARPAGKIFEQDGKLIRPSQDCSVRYGSRIRLNEIELLTATDYREQPCGEIGPEWLRNNLATHTLTQNERFRVLDGNLRVRRPWGEILGGKQSSSLG